VQVDEYAVGDQEHPAVASDALGNFIVVWQSYGSSPLNNPSDSSSWSVQGQRFASDGTRLGLQFQVNSYITSYQWSPAVASGAAGKFVVVWESNGSSGGDSSGFSIQGQRFAADGTLLGAQFQVNSYTTGAQRIPTVTSDAAGHFVVVWPSAGSSGTDKSDYSIQGQRFAADGTPFGGQFQVNTFTTGTQHFPAAASDAMGRFFVAWTSAGSSGTDSSGYSVQSQRYGFPTITVGSSSPGTGGGSGCTLRDALTAAASGAATGGCNAGNQGAVIDLEFAASEVALDSVDNGGANGLPLVSNNVQVLGHGKTIRRLASLACPSGGTEFRLFQVAAGAVLDLDQTTVTGGCLSAADGGDLSSAGAVLLTSSSVTGGQAVNGGGAAASGAIFLFDSTLSGNVASGAGGGLRTTPAAPADAPALLFRSTLSGNTAGSGAGASLSGFTLAANATVSGNAGGGLELGHPAQLSFVTVTGNSTQPGVRTTSARTTLDSSLVGANAGLDCVVAGGSLAAQGANLDTDGTCLSAAGSHFTNVATLGLGPLAANGGPTLTHLPRATSPALDAALDSKTIAGALLLTDQRGVKRPGDDNDDLVFQCDLGAVELGRLFRDSFDGTGLLPGRWAAKSP